MADSSRFRGFNVGGQGTRVKDLARIVGELFGREYRTDVAGPNEGEPSVVIADIGRARADLGWEPRLDLRAEALVPHHRG